MLRWTHPQRGNVPPLQFIPRAEETGAIVDIGQWVLGAACDRLAAWADDPLACDLSLSINVGGGQFRRDDFVDSVRASLQPSGARADRMELEFTESLVMGDVADAVAKMQALRALGVAFSGDDFGTGYSSLACLQRLQALQAAIHAGWAWPGPLRPDHVADLETVHSWIAGTGARARSTPRHRMQPTRLVPAGPGQRRIHAYTFRP